MKHLLSCDKDGPGLTLWREGSSMFHKRSVLRFKAPIPAMFLQLAQNARLPVGAMEGEVDSDPKKACLDGTLRGMTRRGLGQGGDPKCPPGQKQWMTLGPKYRLCVCHLGKPVPNADQGGWVFGESSGSSPCVPSFALSVLFFWISQSTF